MSASASARSDYPQAVRAAEELVRRTGVPHHDVVVVLGSGWADAADALGTVVAELPVTDLPDFWPPVADGHLGLVRSADCDGTPVLVFLGRTHLYEGHGPGPVAHAVRTAAAAGARLGVLTNANGSLHPEWATGTGMLVSDHLNLSHQTPLAGARFVDQSGAWSPRLRAWAREADPALVEGTYAMLPGPEYQTLAETQMLRTLGADVVGMSTVLEAIAAQELGLELLGLSVVTTREGTGEVIDPQEVVAVASEAAARLGATIAEVIRRWAKHGQ
jgi:purine-nucleoside phosphorylase